MLRHSTIAIMISVALAACGGESIAATTTSPASGDTPSNGSAEPATSTTVALATTTSSVPDADLKWVRVAHDEAVFGGPVRRAMSAVTAGGPGLVAVGWTNAPGGGDAMIWTSGDGLAWTGLPNDEVVFGGPNSQRINAIAAGGPGLVAVGAGNAFSGDHAAVWTSVDGLTWTRVPYDEAAFGPTENEPPEYAVLEMRSVVAGGPGLVAVGTGGEPSDPTAVVWTSVDGVTWSRVPSDETVFGGPGAQIMASIVAGGPGLVAVGSESFGEPSVAVVWTSNDGIVWSRVPHDDEAFGGLWDPDTFNWESAGRQEMRSVVAGGPGLVAVGREMREPDLSFDAAVWTSVDGISWSRVPHDEAIFGGPDGQFQEMNSVTVGGPGLIAVGREGYGDDWHAAVWTSVDGIVWSRVAHDATSFGESGSVLIMKSVTAFESGIVAVGEQFIAGETIAENYEDYTMVAVAWLADLAD